MNYEFHLVINITLPDHKNLEGKKHHNNSIKPENHYNNTAHQSNEPTKKKPRKQRKDCH